MNKKKMLPQIAKSKLRPLNSAFFLDEGFFFILKRRKKKCKVVFGTLGLQLINEPFTLANASQKIVVLPGNKSRQLICCCGL